MTRSEHIGRSACVYPQILIGKTALVNEQRAVQWARTSALEICYYAAIHNALTIPKGARDSFGELWKWSVATVFDDLKPNTFGAIRVSLKPFWFRIVSVSTQPHFVDKALVCWAWGSLINQLMSTIGHQDFRIPSLDLLTRFDKPNVLFQPRRRVSLVVDISHEKVVISSWRFNRNRKNDTRSYSRLWR